MYGAQIIITFACAISTFAWPEQATECTVRARTEAGVVCGMLRSLGNGKRYASFRGVPYAKQPLNELRFKELQPLDPWEGNIDATMDAAKCPQQDVLYGRLKQDMGTSESCIHASIHVPEEDLPGDSHERPARDLLPPYKTAIYEETPAIKKGLPVVVFIHGGGFAFGSGDADIYGPEYLVSKGVVVVTFNYRLNLMGFLSLNTTSVPGNNGLRDMVTLLRWVKRNVRAFGGDPDDVTLAGQSAGASSAHLLSLSTEAEGLFKRVWMMSGVGIPIFFTTSTLYANYTATLFLNKMNITSKDPEVIHQQLIDAPLETLMDAHRDLINEFGLTTFMPVVESRHPGVKPIIDQDPEMLIANGRGKTIPIVVGFTNVECETFRPRFTEIDIMKKINGNQLLMVSPHILYTTPPTVVPNITNAINAKYFKEVRTMDDFVKLCTDQYFKYPALRLASLRGQTGGAPMYLYEFSYNDDQNVLREAWGTNYTGAAHIEDMTYVLKVNSMTRFNNNDHLMKEWMTTLFTNFMKSSDPGRASVSDISYWLPVANQNQITFQNIAIPWEACNKELTENHREVKTFFDTTFSKVTV